MVVSPFSVRVRETIELADSGAANPAESASRALVLELGHGIPETQFGLTDGHRTVWCDLRIGRHIVEFDGKVKYRSRETGGLAVDPAQALWEEKTRQDFITGFKLGVSRLTHADLTHGRAAASRRLARECADTASRYGTSIADLAPYIVRRAA